MKENEKKKKLKHEKLFVKMYTFFSNKTLTGHKRFTNSAWTINWFPFFDFSFKTIKGFFISNFSRNLLPNLWSQLGC